METIEASFDHLIRENPIGEARKDALKLDFDRRLKLEFHGTKVTDDAGNVGNPGYIKSGRKGKQWMRFSLAWQVDAAYNPE